jgi:predicted transcriptional regulator of viral defense system
VIESGDFMNMAFKTIKKIAERNDGIVTTKWIEDAGLSRMAIKPYVEDGSLIRESQGVYSLASIVADEFKLIQVRSEKIVFSYGTALYLHGMSDRVPHIFDVSVPQGYNGSRIKKTNPDLRFHYVKKEIWPLGITLVRSPLGADVRVYDKERCICDLILGKKDMDLQLYIQALKEYFKSGSNTRRMLTYAKILGIEDSVRTYMEVLL